MKAYREANKRWPLPVSGTAETLNTGKGRPPAPWLVEWFFANRLRANFGTGFNDDQIAANDRLWDYICEHNAPPPSDWLAEHKKSPVKDRADC